MTSVALGSYLKLPAAAVASGLRLTVQVQDFPVDDGTANGGVASCPGTQQAISGGVITGANDSYVTNTVPVTGLVGELNDGQTFTGWRGYVYNQTGSSGTIISNVYVVCAG